jgi:phosphatidate cytidylyltransferase
MMTDTPSDLWILLLGLGAFLAMASAVGAWLARGEGAASPTIQNLNARINAWWVMVALMGLALVFGKVGATVLFALCAFAALREFLTLTDTRRADHLGLAAAFFLVIPVQFWLVAVDWYGLYSIFIPVYAFLLLPIVVALRGDTTRFLTRIAELQWALMVCVFCVSHVPALLSLTIPGFQGQNVLLIAFLVVVVQGSDVAQYIWGKLLGRRKIAPDLSPSKTVEGFVGGALTATLLGAGLSWLTPFAPLQAAGMALVIVLMGFFGGLVMSAIKRDRGVKDWGSLIPGHGGFIDRLDSVIFAAPVFFHLTRWFWSTT